MSSNSTNLDFLRSVAVLCVFVSHVIYYAGWRIDFPLAGAGVLLFFVHTALVLMMSMEKMKEENMVANFYIRRIFRIYPLSLFCTSAVLLFHIPSRMSMMTFAPSFLPKFEPPFSASEIITNLALVQNLFPNHRSIIGTLWTLPYEVQMYLVLPAIFLFLRRVPGKLIPSNLLVLAVWIVSLTGAYFVPALVFAPCFIGGVFAYQLSKERTFNLPGFVFPISLTILLSLFLLLKLTVLPDYRSDYLLCMFLGGIIPNVLDLKSSWLTTAGHYIAKYSYGIYLCHLPILSFCLVRLHSLPITVRCMVLVALMLIVPVALFHLLEEPCIKFGRSLQVARVPAADPLSALRYE